MDAELEGVWVFNGTKADFPSGVFRTRERAEEWIHQNALTGTLTWYPLDEGTYDWAVRKGAFTPKRDDQRSATFIQAFTAGAQQHFHYEKGR
jgi:hypothetical protein